MKKFEELSEELKARALKKSMDKIISAICEGFLRFNDELNEDDLQARIDACFDKANKNQTPWFAAEYLFEDDKVRQAIEGMAQCDAEDLLYREPGDPAVEDLDWSETK